MGGATHAAGVEGRGVFAGLEEAVVASGDIIQPEVYVSEAAKRLEDVTSCGIREGDLGNSGGFHVPR
jgi:hypothetical protein